MEERRKKDGRKTGERREDGKEEEKRETRETRGRRQKKEERKKKERREEEREKGVPRYLAMTPLTIPTLVALRKSKTAATFRSPDSNSSTVVLPGPVPHRTR